MRAVFPTTSPNKLRETMEGGNTQTGSTRERQAPSPSELMARKKPRVIPSSQVLTSTIDGGRLSCPLIQEFLRTAGKSDEGEERKVIAKKNIIHEVLENQASSEPCLGVGSIDDSVHSRIAAGQHRRFAQLTDMGSSRQAVPQLKTEYRRLRANVESEQGRYFEALAMFWQEQKERLSIGFRGGRVSGFTELALRRNMSLDTWTGMGLPTHYGKCCQIISLNFAPPPDSDHIMSNVVDSVLHEHVSYRITEDHCVPMEPALKNGATIPLPKREGFSHIPLQSDPEALRLALEYRVDIVLSDSTLQLLMIADRVGSWVIPTIRMPSPSEFLVLGEPTITSFSSPRECLSRGFRDALFHEHFCQENASDVCGSSQERLEYGYIVLSLPSVRHKKRRVLVRRAERSGFFLRLHAHAEYFPERGEEIPRNSDKALWMLDYILEPNSRVVVAKIDPSKCYVLTWEDVSLAHALTRSDAVARVLPDFDVSCSDRWYNLLHLLAALPTIGPNKHMLCYPCRGEHRSGPSISVHLLDERQGDFCVSDMLNGGQVSLAASAFRQCYRPWQWNHDRTPYTFPTK